jgi:hypothetical protein
VKELEGQTMPWNNGHIYLISRSRIYHIKYEKKPLNIHFEEILQASKFIFKISEMRGPYPKVSYFNAVITVITDHKKSEKIVNKSPLLTEVSTAKVCRQSMEKNTNINE